MTHWIKITLETDPLDSANESSVDDIVSMLYLTLPYMVVSDHFVIAVGQVSNDDEKSDELLPKV